MYYLPIDTVASGAEPLCEVAAEADLCWINDDVGSEVEDDLLNDWFDLVSGLSLDALSCIAAGGAELEPVPEMSVDVLSCIAAAGAELEPVSVSINSGQSIIAPVSASASTLVSA